MCENKSVLLYIFLSQKNKKGKKSIFFGTKICICSLSFSLYGFNSKINNIRKKTSPFYISKLHYAELYIIYMNYIKRNKYAYPFLWPFIKQILAKKLSGVLQIMGL